MIRKFKIDCIRETQKNLDEDDLLRIMEISKNIKLIWKEKYVIFKYAKPEDDEFSLKGFYPYCGSWELIGSFIEVKTYTHKEFLEMYKSSDKMVAIDVDTSHLGTCDELFCSSEMQWYIDYSKLVSFLEEKKCLKTYLSENWLSVDGRKFKLRSIAAGYVPSLKEYLNSWYEVDSLGTIMFCDLTKLLETLCEYFQKSLK